MNSRQKTTLIYLIIAIVVAYTICTLLGVGILPWLLPPILFAGALVYSNEKYILYQKSGTLWITVFILVVVSAIEKLLSFILLENIAIVVLVLRYLFLALVMIRTQRGVKLGKLQWLVGLMFIVIQYLFFTDEPASSRFYTFSFLPEIVTYFFLGLFCISLMRSEEKQTEHLREKAVSEMSDNIVNENTSFSGFLKFSVLAIIIVFIVFAATFVWLVSGFGLFDTPKQDMIANFEKNENQIYQLKQYVEKVDPSHSANEIEFYIHEKNGIFSISVNRQSVSEGYKDFESFQATDSLLVLTPWTKEKLSTLKNKLDEINCKSIAITSGYFSIGLKGQYRLFYNLLAPSVMPDLYRDTCRYMIFSPAVIFEYKYDGEMYAEECFPKE